MSGALEGRNAIVTGGGSGIGLACAKAFVVDGADVLIMGRSEDRLKVACEEIAAVGPGVAVGYCQGDVGNEDDVAAAIEQAATGGKLDIAVANAGTGGLGPIMVTEAVHWDEIMRTNLSGTFYTIKHAARKMAASGGGAICAISSIAGVRTHRYMGPYCVSKAGIDMLVRNAADELGRNNIRVNSVCPGLVETDLTAGLFETKEVYEDYLACMPISRHGLVGDIGQAVRFLCGPESSWVTGVVLSVDGGHHLRRGPDVEPFSRMLYGDDTTEGRLP